MDSYIITGSSGMVGAALIQTLLHRCDCKIYAVSTNPQKIAAQYSDEKRVICLSLEELAAETAREAHTFRALLHCAFARSQYGGEIASSLDYLQKTLTVVKQSRIGSFIHVSSQGVYGLIEPPPWKETARLAPDSLYAMGKYASELIVHAALADTDIKYTNIRLASVSENAKFLNVFVKNALNNVPIKVMGGTQTCSFIDIRDVANALTAVLLSDVELERVYNLGAGLSRTIAELADDVKRIYKTLFNGEATIETEAADIQLNVGMDNTRFCQTFHWQPQYGYDDMIISLFNRNCAKN